MKGKGFFKELYKNRALYSMFLPAAAVLILFNYLPMFGMVTAFKDFNFADGIFGSPWISPLTKNFEYLFSSGSATRATWNTILLNLLFIVFGLVFELGFALMFNELRMKKFKSAVQFGIFLPYFISWIVVGLFSYNLFNYEHGSLNTLLKLFGMEAINWYENPKMWVVILVVFRVWKMTGYGMIMYIAALGGIDTTYYEAAKIDGAGEFKRYIAIALPLSRPALTTVGIYAFINAWSDYLAPLIYINKTEKLTLSLGLQGFLNQYSVDWTHLMAAATIFVIPVVIFFLFFQRNFVEGIATSGIKG